MSPSRPSDHRDGPAPIGRHRLERQLHVSSRFEYWLERDHRFVVLRMLPELAQDEETRACALEALQRRMAIVHPRIPRLVEIIESPLAAVCEYVPGRSAEVIAHASKTPMPAAVAARIVEQIARTLHQARIPPRWCSRAGLDPNSIVIDPLGAPHLLLAPVFDVLPASSGTGLGARAIADLPPEAVRGMPLLPQSTVFALGVLLYQLTVGRHPFRRQESMLETLQRIIESDYDPIPSDLDVPTTLATVLTRTLEVGPEARYLHAGELADVLARVLPPQLDERAILDVAVERCPELAGLAEALRDTEPTEPALDRRPSNLLAQIEAEPDVSEPYLVYADWLQANGLPRGELIVLQHQQLDAPVERKRVLKEAEAQLLLEHPELAGELTPLLDGPLPHRAAAFRAGPHFVGDLSRGPFAVEWFLGFVRSLRIGVGEDTPDFAELEGVVRRLDAHEGTRFIRHLTLGSIDLTPTRRSSWMELGYAALAGSRLALDSLYVGDLASASPRMEHHGTANISSAFPSLKQLAIRGSNIHLGRLLLPELRELRIYAAGLTADTINHVASSSLPKLEYLELWFGGAPGRSAWPDRVGVLFDVRHLPSLRRLALSDREPRAVTATIAVLSESDLAGRLTMLDLQESAMTDDAAEIILRSADRFPLLEEVRFDGRSISAAPREALSARYSFSQKGRSGPTSSIG